MADHAPTRTAPLLGTRQGTFIAAAAGVLWPVLALMRVPLTNEAAHPSWTDSPASIIDFYSNASFDAAFRVGLGAVTLAYVVLLVFVAKLADLFGSLDGRSRWVGYVIIGGAVLDVGLALGYLGSFATGVFWASHGGLSADGYLVLNGLSWSFLWLDMIALALWLTAVGVAIVRTGLFPRWLGWAILVNVAALLASFLLPVAVWLVSAALPYLWILVAGLLMLVRPERYSEPTPSIA